MACYHPVTVAIKRSHSGVRDLQEVGCGHCIGCRADQARDWSFRIMHESSMHDDSWFVTLTYSDERLPENGSLDSEDFRGFIKALRRDYPPGTLSFYGCGEYGKKTNRPHYHTVLFGADILDRVYLGLRNGNPIWRAPSLEKAWDDRGVIEFSTVNAATAAYTAGYVREKLYLKNSPDAYTRVDPESGELFDVEPEFQRMSLRPAIGLRWLRKYWREVYPADVVVMDGKEFRPPRYYDKVMARECKKDEKCFADTCDTHRKVMLEVKEKRYEELVDLENYKLKAKEAKHRARLNLYDDRCAV